MVDEVVDHFLELVGVELLLLHQLTKGRESLLLPEVLKRIGNLGGTFYVRQGAIDELLDQLPLGAEIDFSSDCIKNELPNVSLFRCLGIVALGQQCQDILHVDDVAVDQLQFKVQVLQDGCLLLGVVFRTTPDKLEYPSGRSQVLQSGQPLLGRATRLCSRQSP